MKTNACKGCGAPIVWGETCDGRRIPLDPRVAVYQAVEERGAHVVVRRIESRINVRGEMVAAYASHFATCPKASEFSGSSRRGLPASER